LDNSNASPYDDLYQKYGQQYGVDPQLLKAQGKQESNFDPDAKGPATPYGRAQGIAQLIPDTASRLNVDDPYDPDKAIEAQAKLMAENIKKYGNINDAISAYHGGTDRDNWGSKTQDYTAKVLQNYANFHSNQPTTASAKITPISYQAASDSDEKNLPGNTSIDPLDARYQAIQAGKDTVQTSPTSSSAGDSDDPLEKRFSAIQSGKDIVLPTKQIAAANSTQTTNSSQPIPQKPFWGNSVLGTAKDIAESAPTGFVEGVNNLLKLPGETYTAGAKLGAQLVNKLYNRSAGQDGNEAVPLTDAEQAENIRKAGNDVIGNTLNAAPTLSQLPALAENLFSGNNLSYKELTSEPDPVMNALHQPTTGGGEIAAGLTSALAPGKVVGISNASALGASAGSQIANRVSPDNPTAQLVGGALGGIAPAAAKAINFRTPPEEIANKIVQGNVDNTGKNPLTGAAIDTSEIVPGAKPTLAEATGNPNVAVLERQAQMQDPAAFAANENVREAARKAYFEKASGTPQDIEALKTQREAATTPLYDQARTQPLDVNAVKPILQKIDAAVAQVGDGSDAGKTLLGLKSKIQGALPTEGKTKTVSTGLLDEQGNPIAKEVPVSSSKNSTQSPLVQIYREERDNLQKPAIQPGAYAATVKSIIQPIVGQLGDAIESQSPEFAKAQQTYRAISPKIDAAPWMQGLKLTDATGKFTLAKVNNALQNAQKLRTSPGLNPAKSLTQDQMDALTNLRDDLLRRENVARASMPRNSATVQNSIAQNALTSGLAGKVNTLTGGNLPSAVGAGVGSAIGHIVGWPSGGAYIGDLLGRGVSNRLTGKSAEAKANLQNYLLNPEDYKQYLQDAQKNHYLNRVTNNLFQNP